MVYFVMWTQVIGKRRFRCNLYIQMFVFQPMFVDTLPCAHSGVSSLLFQTLCWGRGASRQPKHLKPPRLGSPKVKCLVSVLIFCTESRLGMSGMPLKLTCYVGYWDGTWKWLNKWEKIFLLLRVTVSVHVTWPFLVQISDDLTSLRCFH